MSEKIKIPKTYKEIIDVLWGMDVHEARQIRGKEIQPIAHIIAPVASMAWSRKDGSFLIKKKKFEWDGCSIEL